MTEQKKKNGEHIFTPYLVDGEELLWVDKPIRSLKFIQGILGNIIIFGGITLFFGFLLQDHPNPWILIFFFGGGFLLVTVVGLLLEYISWKRHFKSDNFKGTWYALTTYRIMIRSKDRIDSHFLDRITDIQCSGQSITFGDTEQIYFDESWMQNQYHNQKTTISQVVDAPKIYDLICNQIEHVKSGELL